MRRPARSPLPLQAADAVSLLAGISSPTSPWLIVIATLGLAACSSTPNYAPVQEVRPPVAKPNPAPQKDDAVKRAATTPSVPKPAPAASANMSPRGGGYYKDDGPGDDPPPNLAEIPDAEPKSEPLHRFANRPYSALGQDFVPMTASARNFVQQGMASWYGRRFHGRRTSSGEPYNMYGMTAAHPTLPIPSYVRVTNLENGRSVVVRINDRGPFHKNRIIDLSYTAAWKLGYINAGSARVEVEALIAEEMPMEARNGNRRPEAAPPVAVASNSPVTVPPEGVINVAANNAGGLVATAPSTGTPAAPARVEAPKPAAGIFLQLGAFSSERNAESFRDYVQGELRWLKATLNVLNEAGRLRLHAGPFESLEAARAAADRIAQAIKLKPFVVHR